MNQDVQSILVVDDEDGVREALCEFLKDEGYNVESAVCAESAVDILKKRFFRLVITDLKLPGMDGIALSKLIIDNHPHTGIIIITAYGNVPSALEAMRFGADDYILKPFTIQALRHAVEKVFEKQELLLKNLAYRVELEKKVKERAQEIESAATNLGQTFYKIIHVFGNALESREPYLFGRTERITIYALYTARELEWDQHTIAQLMFGAPISDIGKLAIPVELLLKSDPLEPSEKEVMRTHVEEGVKIVGNLAHFLDASAIIHFHHEKFDGSGYPLGLAGEAIPAPARLVAICDSFDAMVHSRPWRGSKTWEEAASEINDLSGTAYDPEIAKGFLAILEEKKLHSLIGQKPTELFYEQTLSVLASPESWPA